MRQRLRYEDAPAPTVPAPTVKEKAALGSSGQARLAAMLWASFEDAPVEDGMGHPAEHIIGEALASEERQQVLDWLRAVCTDVSQPSFAASALRCLSRQDDVGTASWRAGLVREGLAVHNAEVRDAAVQAVESWTGRALLEVLRAHAEPEPWLRQYIRDVLDDLAD